LQDRAQKLKARRESILIDMAGTRRQTDSPVDKITSAQVHAFGGATRIKLLYKENGFSKQYLRLLVSEIRMLNGEVRMTGSKAALANAMLQKKKDTAMVPTFVQTWLPDLDSNQGPAD
jgi:site-specific DNA recombinase